ncbi:restriction endonuclease subunit S [Legionella sp. 31fI33]|uniref:restriction endonuclease subunit S n=1 Tax=Legionella sp. 31fI33 TaxID=2886376 RepID=UPI001E4F9449|nr:restriction endonuclease subunit S [Legionella sp. 31fI33]MCC5014864.1 restriction endonuclease subunit S [Legionella sp. 31fI33]
MRYQSFKDHTKSSVTWLNTIPSHWIEKRLKYLCFIKTGDKDTINANSEGLYPFFVRSQSVERINTYTADCEAVLTAGDGAGVGKVFHYYVGKFDFHQRVYMLSNFKNCLGKFIYFYLKSNFYKVALDGMAKSTVDSLRLPLFLNFDIVLPPINEQQKIVYFLDKETTKIDKLIEKQKQLIQLLEEKSQAVISHAVTKGLNSNVEMKNSEVEWLGCVPEHWKIRRIKTLFQIKKRIAGTLGYDVLSITQKGIKVKDIESGEGQLSMDYTKYQLVNIGDFAMNHMDLLTGWVDIAKQQGVTSPDYRVFSLTEKEADPKYYLYVLQMGYNQKIFYAYGQGSSHLGRWRFPTEAFQSFYFPFPPENEQKEISNFIENVHLKISNLVEKSKKAISLLNERRTALISAAVTGKIDVRNIT